MEPKFQSSFIPKGPIATASSVASVRTSEKNLLGFLAKGIFVLTVIASLGVFGYNFYLKYSIGKMGADLEQARATIDPASITNLARLDQRIISTNELLSNHVIISPVFDFLQSSTLKSVRFMTFDFNTTDKGLVLSMSGQARDYAAVALQAEALSKNKSFKNPVFSNLNLDDKGNVTFTFSATIDPSLVSYKKEIERRDANTVNKLDSGISTATSTATTTPARTATTTNATTTRAVSTSSPITR